MIQPSRCPSDRSELLSVLENRATEALRAHVESCERCRLELRDLGSALELISPATEVPPSRGVRRAAVAYARSQVRVPASGWTWWRAPVAGIAGVVFAVLFGGLAEARLTFSPVRITTPDSGTLVLAAVWSLGLFLYATPGGSALRREMVTNALAGAAAFTLLLIALPISKAVEVCVTWAYGPGQLSSGNAWWAFALVTSLYAALSSALVSRIRSADLSWSDACGAALSFAVLAGPLLFVVTTSYPPIAGIGCLVCGAWMGERLGSRR